MVGGLIRFAVCCFSVLKMTSVGLVGWFYCKHTSIFNVGDSYQLVSLYYVSFICCFVSLCRYWSLRGFFLFPFSFSRSLSLSIFWNLKSWNFKWNSISHDEIGAVHRENLHSMTFDAITMENVDMVFVIDRSFPTNLIKFITILAHCQHIQEITQTHTNTQKLKEKNKNYGKNCQILLVLS